MMVSHAKGSSCQAEQLFPAVPREKQGSRFQHHGAHRNVLATHLPTCPVGVTESGVCIFFHFSPKFMILREISLSGLGTSQLLLSSMRARLEESVCIWMWICWNPHCRESFLHIFLFSFGIWKEVLWGRADSMHKQGYWAVLCSESGSKSSACE